MSFFTRSQQGISTPFMEDIWSRNLLNFFASPLTIAEYLAGFVAISIFTSIIGVVFMALCAWIGFGFSVLTYGLSLFLLLITLFICGISLGIIAIAILLRFGPSAEWFIWPIPAVLSPFVGVYYPIAVLPGWMQFIGRLVPLSYVFEGARGLILHDGASVLFLIVGTALSFVYLGISCVVFGRVYRRVVREGTLARMGTE
jgi:ABC-2 type transport system permease protein